MSQYRISLISGGFFDYADIDDSEYSIEDIANNLSRLCRFTGSVHQHYSVAQHSVIVSNLLPKEHKLAGLMHDAGEAFLNDMNSPLKSMMPAYKKLEKKVEKHIFNQLGLKFPMDPAIKLADMQVFLAENRDLRNITGDCGWYAGVEPYGKTIKPWTAEKAKREFLKRYRELTK